MLTNPLMSPLNQLDNAWAHNVLYEGQADHDWTAVPQASDYPNNVPALPTVVTGEGPDGEEKQKHQPKDPKIPHPLPGPDSCPPQGQKDRNPRDSQNGQRGGRPDQGENGHCRQLGSGIEAVKERPSRPVSQGAQLSQETTSCPSL